LKLDPSDCLPNSSRCRDRVIVPLVSWTSLAVAFRPHPRCQKLLPAWVRVMALEPASKLLVPAMGQGGPTG